LEDERKTFETVPEQLDESLAFGTVLGAPTWTKPPHSPGRPTAAALAPQQAATAVALADPPSADPTMPIPTTGGGGDGDVPSQEPSDAEDSAAEEIEEADESSQDEAIDGADLADDSEEEPADEPADEGEAEPADEESTDDEAAADEAEPADEDEPQP
jgi:RND superfamily putative drug exporter